LGKTERSLPPPAKRSSEETVESPWIQEFRDYRERQHQELFASSEPEVPVSSDEHTIFPDPCPASVKPEKEDPVVGLNVLCGLKLSTLRDNQDVSHFVGRPIRYLGKVVDTPYNHSLMEGMQGWVHAVEEGNLLVAFGGGQMVYLTMETDRFICG
jgi:hypothetical protein